MRNAASPSIVLYHGDCLDMLRSMPTASVDLVVTSPPYAMGKPYERSRNLVDFVDLHARVIPEAIRIIKPSGNICWQVGCHVINNTVTPLDFIIHGIFSNHKNIFLRNRIIWHFGHGAHCNRRFSGRHETILWYSKESYHFDLNSVRIPQKYPGKKSYKGPRKGEFSGNPFGKNPGDVWEIPNVKANHVEKTSHPCQFPVALVQRLIRALTPNKGLVVDPFMGSGSTGVAAVVENRNFAGSEILAQYLTIAQRRISDAMAGSACFRPEDQPVYVPQPTSSVARKPAHFR